MLCRWVNKKESTNLQAFSSGSLREIKDITLEFTMGLFRVMSLLIFSKSAIKVSCGEAPKNLSNSGWTSETKSTAKCSSVFS